MRGYETSACKEHFDVAYAFLTNLTCDQAADKLIPEARTEGRGNDVLRYGALIYDTAKKVPILWHNKMP